MLPEVLIIFFRNIEVAGGPGGWLLGGVSDADRGIPLGVGVELRTFDDNFATRAGGGPEATRIKPGG